MNEAEIKSVIFQLLKQIAPDTEPSTLQPGENIREVLGIDSFDALQFLVALDEKLGIAIPEQDYGKTATLENLLAYLQVRMVAKK
jgi:acyl carrier protein